MGRPKGTKNRTSPPAVGDVVSGLTPIAALAETSLPQARNMLIAGRLPGVLVGNTWLANTQLILKAIDRERRAKRLAATICMESEGELVDA